LERFVLLAAVSFSVASGVDAQVTLVQPIACDLGDTCVIQQFMDRLPDESVSDFACGAASYDGHKGTDFRVHPEDMKKGVPVLAASDGEVMGLRNTMADKRVESDADHAAVKGKDCGNGVVLRHNDGWETQYCHMKQGSVRVTKGQKVAAGDVLGFVGLSGQTQFPHLHLSVRKDGVPVDPFAPEPMMQTCGFNEKSTLWAAAFATQFQYQPTQVMEIGLANGKVELSDIVDGVWADFTPQPDQPLVIFGLAVNGAKGDQIRLELQGPEGVDFAQTDKPLLKRKAQWFVFYGKNAPTGGWPAGTYTAKVDVMRNGVALELRTKQYQMP
jgi:hypothetical protein